MKIKWNSLVCFFSCCLPIKVCYKNEFSSFGRRFGAHAHTHTHTVAHNRGLQFCWWKWFSGFLSLFYCFPPHPFIPYSLAPPHSPFFYFDDDDAAISLTFVFHRRWIGWGRWVGRKEAGQKSWCVEGGGREWLWQRERNVRENEINFMGRWGCEMHRKKLTRTRISLRLYILSKQVFQAEFFKCNLTKNLLNYIKYLTYDIWIWYMNIYVIWYKYDILLVIEIWKKRNYYDTKYCYLTKKLSFINI